nr:hypothetical protein Iba_chr12aCG14020 [Ipomoea batatas]
MGIKRKKRNEGREHQCISPQVWDQNRGVQAETLQIGGDDCPQTQSAEMLTLLRVPKFKPTGLSYHF